jgi:hypothetical protein
MKFTHVWPLSTWRNASTRYVSVTETLNLISVYTPDTVTQIYVFSTAKIVVNKEHRNGLSV